MFATVLAHFTKRETIQTINCVYVVDHVVIKTEMLGDLDGNTSISEY